VQLKTWLLRSGPSNLRLGYNCMLNHRLQRPICRTQMVDRLALAA